MARMTLQEFTQQIHDRFPNLRQFDETRLFSVLLSAGVVVEFELDPDGSTHVRFDEITPDAEAKLRQS